MQPSILFPSSSRLTPSQPLPQDISVFGRLKVEFFCGRDWQGVAMDEFMGKLDGCMVWYRDRRRKSDLGHVNPMQYRKNLGLAA